MNLGEMAAYVTEKLGKTDPDSLAQTKRFLQRRYALIYASGLWKDTLEIFDYTARGTKLEVLPIEIGRPLAVWDKKGGIPFDIDNVSSVLMRNPSALMAGDYGTFSFSEGPSLGWPYPLGDGARLSFINAGNPELKISISGWGETQSLPLLPHGSTQTLVVGESGVAQSAYWGRIDKMTKPISPFPILVGQLGTSPTPTWYWPGDLEDASFATIRLVPPTQAGRVLQLYAKRRFRPMVNDSDSPLIRSIENTLLALAQADMLERARQYTKAAAKTGEATTMLAIAKDEEINQSAHEVRVIPQVDALEGTEESMDWS